MEGKNKRRATNEILRFGRRAIERERERKKR